MNGYKTLQSRVDNLSVKVKIIYTLRYKVW